MIRYYCQYSYGGFKTFLINGEPREALTLIVTEENNYGFPELANVYFNQGGVKILYRYLDKDTLSLLVKEIPSSNLDTDNRSISSAIQFIGNAADRGTLDRLAIHIANNLEKFEKDFADMFDLRGGLHFEGDKLAAIVKDCETECNYDGNSKLLNVRQQKGIVLLFVPFSDNFGKDEKVTAKLLSELQLPQEAQEESKLIRLSELMSIQYLVKPIVMKAEKKTDETNTIDVEKLQAKMAELQEENTRLRKTAANATSDLDTLKKGNEKRDKTITILGVVLCVLLFILVLANCKVASAIILGLILAGFSFKTYKLLKP